MRSQPPRPFVSFCCGCPMPEVSSLQCPCRVPNCCMCTACDRKCPRPHNVRTRGPQMMRTQARLGCAFSLRQCLETLQAKEILVFMRMSASLVFLQELLRNIQCSRRIV